MKLIMEFGCYVGILNTQNSWEPLLYYMLIIKTKVKCDKLVNDAELTHNININSSCQWTHQNTRSSYHLTLCQFNFNPYRRGRKAAFFSALSNRLTWCLCLDHVYTHEDMLNKWFHHIRQHRATFSFAQRNIYEEESQCVLVRLGRQAAFKSSTL
jgi:hypothetical protein